MKASKKLAKRQERRVKMYDETMRTHKGHPGAYTRPGSQKTWKSVG